MGLGEVLRVRSVRVAGWLGGVLALPLAFGMMATALADSASHMADPTAGNPQAPMAATDLPGQEHAAEDVTIRDGWMQHVGPGGAHLGIYFTVENKSDTPHLIDGITSPSCTAMYGYHSDLEVSSLTRDLFKHLTLPPNQGLTFPPGGYHLVCEIGDKGEVREGSEVAVRFHFLGGSEQVVKFQVRAARPYFGPT